MKYVQITSTVVRRLSDGLIINLLNPSQSTDAATYNAWVAAGNSPIAGPYIASKDQLMANDREMARIGEDLVTLLISKGIFTFTELPLIVQQKITARQTARANIAGETT